MKQHNSRLRLVSIWLFLCLAVGKQHAGTTAAAFLSVSGFSNVFSSEKHRHSSSVIGRRHQFAPQQVALCGYSQELGTPTSQGSGRSNGRVDQSVTDDTDVVEAAPDDRDAPPPPLHFGWSDDEFESWFASQLLTHPLVKDYSRILEMAPKAVRNWRTRFRGNPSLWRRVFKLERVTKELIEAAPILDAVLDVVGRDSDGVGREEEEDRDSSKYTIVDLASGKGYLSMFLSEMLPPDRVERIVLVDKAWPLCGAERPLPHQMSWEHIYGDGGETSYFKTWPIPLHTSKQDLKQKSTRRQLRRVIFDRASGPILILAVHLCGVLSLRAVEMFNDYPDKVSFLALKPCCLPPMVYANRGDVFEIGRHRFDASQVCASGRFRGNVWYGPPRWHLEGRFNAWAEHLFHGVDLGGESPESADDLASNSSPDVDFVEEVSGKKTTFRCDVQVDGGFQNAYVFAERSPVTLKVWNNLSRVH